jgi:xylulokinase
MLVAGVDSSAQSTKVVLCQAGDGAVIGRGRAPHSPGTECNPADWWAVLQQAGEGLLGQAAVVAVAGQQHGLVALDEDGKVIMPELWNDLRSAGDTRTLRRRARPAWWASETGRVPDASCAVTKLHWLAEHEPGHAPVPPRSCSRTTG